MNIAPFFVLFYVLKFSSSSEILCIFPTPSYSHSVVFRAVTEKLLERGHKITLMTTHPNDNERNHVNVTLIDVSFSVKMLDEFWNKVIEKKSWKLVLDFIDLQASNVDKQLETEEMQIILKDKSKKFDLLLLEILSGPVPFHVLADKFGIPVVGIASSDALTMGHEIMGNEINAIAHPDRSLPFSATETFKQRLASCFLNFVMKFFLIPRNKKNFDAVLRKHFPEVNKTTHELVNNVDLLLINTHPVLGFIRPILPNTIPLGFLHIKPPKMLPQELSSLMENSKHGVIYMSFGTVVTAKFYEGSFGTFLKAFSELPYDVLWKYDGEVKETIPPNVHIRKWFPQTDLLAHPNVKLFITHGGQHSIEEAIMRHVPMLVCPFQGDQSGNAHRTTEKRISKTLIIDEKLGADRVKSLITEIIYDPSFKENIVKLAKLVEDAPMPSPEKAVWHIEYVIRNGGAKHLNYSQKEIPFYQYHYYDVLLSVIAAIALALWLIWTAIKFSFRLLKRLLHSKLKQA